MQDPSKVGAGLRTIALRLRGTSAEELSSMGEDTEGLVETTSKLNSNIKSLTAVNGKAGVSILDMNGNYRDTYDILKDISQVWDDIGKQDLADGQNRQAALLEMMAGKIEVIFLHPYCSILNCLQMFIMIPQIIIKIQLRTSLIHTLILSKQKQLKLKNLGHTYGNQKVVLILLKDCLILATAL